MTWSVNFTGKVKISELGVGGKIILIIDLVLDIHERLGFLTFVAANSGK